MNTYRQAMEHCAPPEGLEARTRAAALAAQAADRNVFRPRGFRRRGALVLLAAALILATGAASIWDPLLVRRFGPQAALTYMGGATFQEVNVTSHCGEVSLTVTQALCSSKTIYYILKYRLPDGVDGTRLRRGGLSSGYYYGTGDYTWEQLYELEGEQWAGVDWGEYTSFAAYLGQEEGLLAPYDLRSTRTHDGGGSSGGGQVEGYDPETRELTFLFSLSLDSDWDLTRQPLTILVTPPCLEEEDGSYTPVVDYPAIVTFQPAYSGPQSLSGQLEEGAVQLRATLSPFSLSLSAHGLDYSCYEDMVRDTFLVAPNGQERPVRFMGYTNGGGSVGSEEEMLEVSTILHFRGITDISGYAAVRIGDYTFPLN